LSKKCQFFRRKYFKKHNIGPWSPCFATEILFLICVLKETALKDFLTVSNLRSAAMQFPIRTKVHLKRVFLAKYFNADMWLTLLHSHPPTPHTLSIFLSLLQTTSSQTLKKWYYRKS
jgi:hypothetical protein